MQHLSPPTRLLLQLASANAPLTAAALARSLHLSPANVAEALTTLRGYGYTITGSESGGYRLTARPNAAVPPAVEPHLQHRRFGHPYHYFAQVESTNSLLATMAANGAPAGTVVVAEEQSAGRGRMARHWHSPRGSGLYLSLLLRPEIELSRVTSLPLVVGLALAEVLTPLAPETPPQVKWPNDVWLAGRKVGGILCELRMEPDAPYYVVVGIGLNVNLAPAEIPADLRQRATSVAIAAGRTVSRPALLMALLDQLEREYDLWHSDGFAPFLERFASVDALYGRQIVISRGVAEASGTAVGVDCEGALLLRLADGSSETIYSGEAHISDWSMP